MSEKVPFTFGIYLKTLYTFSHRKDMIIWIIENSDT